MEHTVEAWSSRWKECLLKRTTLIFLFALGIRCIAFLFFIWWFRITGHYPSQGASYPVVGGDSGDYAQLSYNLFANGTFSSSDSSPLIPESFRLPGYSFFLYPFEFLPYPLFFGTIAQMLVGSGSAVLVYLLGKRFLSERAGLLAAVLFSLEPTTVFNAVITMSDTVFVFAMLLGIYTLFTRTPTRRHAIVLGTAAGLLFGYAVLVRVIAQYLAFCLLPAYLVLFRNERPFSTTVLKLLFFIVGMVLVITPWSLRNYQHFGTATISSTPYINFTQYNLVYFYAYEHHTTPPEVQHLFSDPIPYPTSSFWFRSLINEQIFLKEMHDGLEGHVLAYAKFHLVKTLPFFMNDGLRDINLNTHLLYIPPTPTNFTDLLLHKKYADILRYFVTPQPDLVLLVIGSVFWISVSLLWLLGTILSVVKRDERMWFFLIASGIILYFAVLSSPVIQPRYRMPATPFLFLLASETLLGLYTIVRRRYVHPTVPSTSQVPE